MSTENNSGIQAGTQASILASLNEQNSILPNSKPRDLSAIDILLTEETKTVTELIADKADVRKVVVIRPIHTKGFKLGMPGEFITMPGTTQRWAPTKVGNLHRTGLSRNELAPTPEERQARIKELEYFFGKPLDAAFYADMSYKIDSNKPLGQKLFLDRPEDLVVYLAMLESADIANGIHEYKSGKKPFAVWYLEDKEAEAEADSKALDDNFDAVTKYKELSSAKRRKISTMVGLETMGLSDKAADIALGKWIQDKLVNARLFLEIVEKGDTYIAIGELVKLAVKFNFIRRHNGDFFYGDNMIGTSEAQIVSKLSSTQYSDLRLGIQAKVDNKLNAR
jgi:hypothetical protein